MAKGFNRPVGGRNQGGGMMQQIQRLQEQMAQAQAQLAEETVTATVGGGVVKVTMTGAQVCRSVEIDPEVLKDADAEMLQDLILSAVNLALDQSRELAAQRMEPLTGGLAGMPGLF
ncbi:MAG TPA: YbaB/EbfC family nucleoid-associated protein [Anaerolineaceae bacterium]|nr:YbaB/EbfC family nucleoid-associated protein [Anaerolineaceae bacterium]HOD03721.1 YbaB/EbfC family nucleoid-associated protein [Anaerolineaceae bacterium]HOG78213.1 YbaB/EbfC family nucleoid-associated protein [Anaerolineaceae bacterium]HQF62510.1 YbaB/EbfC family nucleoid-associated protein [Anaerolineaceae bacterium]HQH85708.1 YbaB/EbfC family nucleoid-associated protein [Anaerolineaceae bacterium]